MKSRRPVIPVELETDGVRGSGVIGFETLLLSIYQCWRKTNLVCVRCLLFFTPFEKSYAMLLQRQCYYNVKVIYSIVS